MLRMGLLLIALGACKPKPDKEARCREVVEHMRSVSAMPMRDGDVSMVMGACKMWMDGTLDCILAAKNDEEIERCKGAVK
jgi:hypothetical protein